MNITELIVRFHPCLDTFDYDHYPEDFARFEEAAAPLFEGAEQLSAENLLAELTRRYAGLPRKAMKTACFQDKQVLALFFTPAAMHAGGAAEKLAGDLCMLWNRKYPGERYYPGTYETILKGFDANLLGLPLRKSKKRHVTRQ